MHTNHASETQESMVRRVVEANDALPWWFFALIVAVGVAILVASIL